MAKEFVAIGAGVSGNQSHPLRAQRVAHVLKWLLAIAGVFFAVCAIQVAVSVYGSIWLARLDRFGADGSVSSRDVLTIGVATQLVWLAIVWPWWRHVRRRGMGIDSATVCRPVLMCYGLAVDLQTTDTSSSAAPKSRPLSDSTSTTESSALASLPKKRSAAWQSASLARAVTTLLGIALFGIGLQIIVSLLITLILPLFPEVERAYTDMMENSGTDVLTPLSALSLAVLAPVVEELTFRGVAFQFALRAVTPAWNKHLSPGACENLGISRTRFWIANALQALAFGVVHLNITQGIYAFAIGLVLGWLFGRTGRLRYGIALHLAINFSSYFVGDILDVFGLFGGFGPLVLSVVCVVAGINLLMRSTPASPWSVAARFKSL